MSVAYHVYTNTGAGDPINYSSPVATVAGHTYSTAPLAGPSSWSFDVRAFDTLDGLEEQNVDAITVDLDALGNDVSDTPAPPIGLLVLARAGGSIRVEWAYPGLRGLAAPTGFHVYSGAVGAIDYTRSVGTVMATTGPVGTYSTLLFGYANGQTYSVGVRAFNAVAEEANTIAVNVIALSVGPTAVVGLTAIATSAAG